jgi:hypothetical protein
MLFSSLPAKFLAIFGNGADASHIRTIPATSTDPNAASIALGFPPNTFVDPSAGGAPPDGRDVNGIFAQLSAWAQWQGAGGQVTFDTAVATAGGYPKYAVLASTTAGRFWQSTADNNTTNPDGGSPANWVLVAAQAATAAEVLAGTTAFKFVTPAALAGSLGTGDMLTHANGIVEQWGYAAGPFSGGTHAVAFTQPFVGTLTLTNPDIQLTVYNVDTGAADNLFVQLLSFDLSGFIFQLRFAGSGSPLVDGVKWRAIGR